MFKTIVTGVDGREGGRDALRLAAELARIGGGEVIAVGAFPYFHRPSLAAAPAVQVQRDETQAMLGREIADVGIAASTHVVADASPARALHLVAERDGADLIVVGSTRRGVMGRVLVGDDALGTLHGSHVPVAVAPRGFAGSDSVRRIGVGFDGGEESRQGLALAAELARALDAELELLSVIDSPAAMAAETGYSMDWVDEVRAHREERLRQVIEETDATAHGRAVVGTPVEELTALSNDVGLLLIGSRAWGPVRRVLLGSTAAGLMRHAACPLIVLPRGAATGQPGEDQPAGARADSPVRA
jgi:nucleotide-binding universal stress UspA family protein